MRNNQEGLPGPYFNPGRNSKRDLFIEPKFIPGKELPVRPKIKWKRFGAAVLVAAVATDPMLVQIEMGPSKQYIAEVNSSTFDLNRDKVIDIGAGLGLTDSHPTARVLSGFAEYGNVYANVYDNRTIDGDSLGDDLIEKAKHSGVKEINFWGGSMAGMLALEMAVKVQNDKSDIYTKYIILENTPASIDAVRPDKRQSARVLTAMSGNSWVAHSRLARYLIEMGIRTNQYAKPGINKTIPIMPFNLTKFVNTSVEVISDMVTRTDKASIGLMNSQYSSIVSSTARDSMMKLGQENSMGKEKPVIVLVRPKSSTSDQVVDSDKTEEELREYALAAGLRLVIVRIPGIHHGNPSMSESTYAEYIPKIMKLIDETFANPITPGYQDDPMPINNNYRIDDDILLDEPMIDIIPY